MSTGPAAGIQKGEGERERERVGERGRERSERSALWKLSRGRGTAGGKFERAGRKGEREAGEAGERGRTGRGSCEGSRSKRDGLREAPGGRRTLPGGTQLKQRWSEGRFLYAEMRS